MRLHYSRLALPSSEIQIAMKEKPLVVAILEIMIGDKKRKLPVVAMETNSLETRRSWLRARSDIPIWYFDLSLDPGVGNDIRQDGLVSCGELLSTCFHEVYPIFLFIFVCLSFSLSLSLGETHSPGLRTSQYLLSDILQSAYNTRNAVREFMKRACAYRKSI